MNAKRSFVITGCASGIGRHLTGILQARGHHVFATDVNVDELKKVAEQQEWPRDRVSIHRLDVCDAAAWRVVFEEAVSRLGTVDVLLNVAGYVRPGWIHEVDEAEVDRHIDTNAKGVMFGTLTAARYMVRQRRGHIVNFASMAGLVPVPGLALYSAAKYAVRAFSIAAAQELRPHGVFVTVLCPDAVQTPMYDLQKDYDEAVLTFSSPRPLSVEDIERLVLDKVLPRKPLEVAAPVHRGWLARVVNLFPSLSFKLGPFFERRARLRQAHLREKTR